MLKQTIDKVKEYISVIALIPLILGGLWQVLSLSFINPAYIRFFSVTQQVADGIVMLIVFAAIGYFVFVLKLGFVDPVKIEVLDKYSKSRLVTYLSLLLLTAVLFLAIFCLPKGKVQTFSLLLTNIALSSIFFILMLICHKYIIIIKHKNIDNTFVRFLLKPFIETLFNLIALIGVFIVISKLMLEFNNIFNIPYNLKNTKYIIERYCESKNKINKDSVKVLYLNDKYIFIKDSSKIEVVKFDYMFKDSK